MAFSVSSLTNYTDEQKLDLLVRQLYSPDTAMYLASNIVPGIKSAKALPILESTLYPQAGGCGFTSSGTTAITQRVITVKECMFQEALCPTTLETKFTQLGLAAGHPEGLGSFEVSIGNEKAAAVSDWIEPRIWTGSVSNPGEWDGFITILAALGYGGAGDPVEGNKTGGGFTQVTGHTAGNIIASVEQVWNVMPAKVKTKAGVVCFMGADIFDTLMLALKTANLFHYTPTDALAMEMVWPGTRMTVKGLPGMSGTGDMLGCLKSNLYLGTDMAHEEDNFELWWSQDNREVRWNTTFKYGCQIAFPAETVLFQFP